MFLRNYKECKGIRINISSKIEYLLQTHLKSQARNFEHKKFYIRKKLNSMTKIFQKQQNLSETTKSFFENWNPPFNDCKN